MALSSVITQDQPQELVATTDLQVDCVSLYTDIPDTTSGALDFAVDEDRLHTFENVESASMNNIVDVYALDETGNPMQAATSAPFRMVTLLQGPRGE